MLDRIPKAAALWTSLAVLSVPAAWAGNEVAKSYVSDAVKATVQDLERKTEDLRTQQQAVATSQIRTEATVQSLQASQAEIKQDLRTVIQLLRAQ